MKNNFKRFAAIVLAMIMCVSTLVPVFAAETTCPGAGKAHTTDNCEYVAEVIAPTCTANGRTEYTCKTCDTKWSDSFVVALGHDYKEEVVAPTCTVAGQTVKTCTRCSDSFIVPGTSVDATHTWVYEWDTEEEVDICHVGNDWVSRTCSVCKVKEDGDGTKVGGHVWDIKVTKNPTCKTMGAAVGTCTQCGKVKEVKVNWYTGHEPQKLAVVTKATCTTNEWATFKCDICGIFTAENTQNVASAPAVKKAHGINPNDYNDRDYFKALDAKDKTCTANGILDGDKECKVCGAHCNSSGVAYTNTTLKNAGILAGHEWPMTGDEYDWETYQAATCTVAGTLKRTCTDCGASETKTVEAKGHKAPETKTVFLADCTTDGYVKYTCTNGCGVVVTESVTSALGHNYEFVNKTYKADGTSVDDENPICGAWYYINEKCSRTGCDATTFTQVKFADHAYENKVIVKADCATVGYSLSLCKVCEGANPKYAFGTHEETDEEKYVTYGGTKYLMLDVTDKKADVHKLPELGQGVPTTEKPTGQYLCTTDYTEHVVCAHNCGYSADRTVKAAGHKYDDEELDLNKYYTDVQLAEFDEIIRTTLGDCTIKTIYQVGCVNCSKYKVVVANDGTGKGHVKDTDTAHGYIAAANATCTESGTTEAYYCANAWCGNAYGVGDRVQAAETTGTLHNDKKLMTKVAYKAPYCGGAYDSHTKGNLEYYQCPMGKNCLSAVDGVAYRAYEKAGVWTTVTNYDVQIAIYAANSLRPEGNTNSAGEHRHAYSGEFKIFVDPTCTTIGYKGYICADCDLICNLSAPVPTEDHTWVKYDSDNDGIEDTVKITYAGTCEAGIFATATCADCGYVESIDYGKGHYTIMNGNADDAEYYELTGACNTPRAECARCAQIITPAEHEYGAVKYVDGYEISYCVNCNAEKEVYHSHKYVEYTNQGAKHSAACACGETKDAAHAWDDGVVTTEPTETTEGVKTYTCIDCAATKTEKVAVLAHAHKYAYTSISDYKHDYVCACGDVKVSEEHNFKNGVCIDCLAEEVAGGCGASVALVGVALVATLGTCAVFATKKKED